MLGGFTALSKDMKTIGGTYDVAEYEKYETGKVYTFKGYIYPWIEGFNFYEKLEYLSNKMDGDNRIFFIKASGKITTLNKKDFFASEIELVKELTQKEIDDYFKRNKNSLSHSPYYEVRKKVAEYGYRLDDLIEDEDEYVRAEVAEQGYGLRQLVHDKSPIVRATVAKQGYGLEELVHDKFYNVRRAVAEQGYGLEELIHDKAYEVRQKVAKHGYGLEILVNDNHRYVRQEVAKHGYGLEILIHDKNSCVREAVAEQGYGLEELSKDKNSNVRRIAKQKLKELKKHV